MRRGLLILLLAGTGIGQVAPPLPKMARSLSPERIATILRNAPPGIAVSAPIIMAREWGPGWYETGQAVIWQGGAYICIQSHAALEGWNPKATPALWRLVRAPGEKPGDIPAWRQPAGAHNAYAKGEKVRHNGQTWRSLYDANTWEPGVFGWEVANEKTD